MSAQQARKRELRSGESRLGKSGEEQAIERQAREPQAGRTVEFEKWSEAMQGEFDDFLRQTWEAMSVAGKGRWIANTEEVMLEARDRLGRRAYEKLLQLRIEAEQEAFSPSGLRTKAEKQGPQVGDASDGDGTC